MDQCKSSDNVFSSCCSAATSALTRCKYSRASRIRYTSAQVTTAASSALTPKRAGRKAKRNTLELKTIYEAFLAKPATTSAALRSSMWPQSYQPPAMPPYAPGSL